MEDCAPMKELFGPPDRDVGCSISERSALLEGSRTADIGPPTIAAATLSNWSHAVLSFGSPRMHNQEKRARGIFFLWVRKESLIGFACKGGRS